MPHDSDPSTSTAWASLDGTTSRDPDDDAYTASWSCSSGGTEHASAVGLAAQVGLPAGGHTCRLTVVDSYGASNFDDTTINVGTEPNATPVANGGLDQTISAAHKPREVLLDATGSSDSDSNDELEFSWNCQNNVIASGRVVTVTLAACSGNSCSHTCTLTVVDSYGASHSDTVTITLVP